MESVEEHLPCEDQCLSIILILYYVVGSTDLRPLSSHSGLEFRRLRRRGLVSTGPPVCLSNSYYLVMTMALSEHQQRGIIMGCTSKNITESPTGRVVPRRRQSHG